MAPERPGFLTRLRESFSTSMSIGSSAFAAFMRGSAESFGWEAWTAFRNPAFWRGVSIISQTIASLPLKTYRNLPNGEREEIDSWLSTDPAGPYDIIPFNFWEMVVSYLLTMGEVGLLHVYSEAGRLVGLLPLAPVTYVVKWMGVTDMDELEDPDAGALPGYSKVFRITFGDGRTKSFTTNQFTQILGLSVDGLRGLSPMTLFRRQHDLSMAQDEAAMHAMKSGMLIGGLVSAKEDISLEDAQALKAGLDAKVTGPLNANGLAFTNRQLDFKEWRSANVDLTYVQGREFSVNEVSRILGLPPHLLGQVDRSTSWGNGIREQNQMVHRYTLMPITSRIECALSCLLPNPQFVEFDYHGLLQGTPDEEISSLMLQTGGKPILTVNEARRILNLPPVPNGDDMTTPAPPAPPAPHPEKPPSDKEPRD